MEELTDEQIREEEKFLKGLPRVNWGALLMPGVWGPAHGFWICILFYPLYIFIDNLFFAAYTTQEAWVIALAVIGGLLLFGATVAFALISQPIAAHRADDKGVTREQYLKRERIWAVVSLVLAVAALSWATYYNLCVR
ncbi:MAG: viscotoxin-A3 [Coriobacteriaceae bacterium]|jgi:hypothetical protein|nr:viscotoxin-A3 [Coriobacteriaceae bacterium]